jgi:hypothetical protein
MFDKRGYIITHQKGIRRILLHLNLYISCIKRTWLLAVYESFGMESERESIVR